MSTKDQAVIQKLVKIASRQQRILARLAQANEAEAYLRRAAQVAASNSGFTASNVSATYHGGSSGAVGEGTSMVNVEGGWTVTVDGSPKDNKVRQQFINTFKTQVQAQKPDLAKNLSVILPD